MEKITLREQVEELFLKDRDIDSGQLAKLLKRPQSSVAHYLQVIRQEYGHRPPTKYEQLRKLLDKGIYDQGELMEITCFSRSTISCSIMKWKEKHKSDMRLNERPKHLASFEEIGKELCMPAHEVKKIYLTAISKIKARFALNGITADNLHDMFEL